MSVRVRIAPSPTGDPHVGTAYVGLFNWVFARQNKGQFILRIEDTDQARAKSSSEAIIMESLKWLGLDWDEGPDCGGPKGPYRQSERKEIYTEHTQKLLDSGHAYRCFCTSTRLDEVRRQQRVKGLPTGYDRHCRSLSEAEVSERTGAGTAFVVRLKMPTEGETKFQDELRGELSFENKRIDDQVLLKSDGFPTYHLANVVDDHLMEITHVIRAEEWISSTPKHIALYQGFGWEAPKWVHLPLLRNADKSKISKRKNPVSLNYFRRAGYLPEALLNFLSLMGWNPGNDIEKFDTALMQEKFKLNEINLGDPVFDIVKLAWLNQQYMKEMDDKRFSKILREDFFNEEYLLKMKPLVLERLQKLEDFVDQNAFFFTGALHYTGVDLVPKGVELKDLRNMLKELVEKLDELYDWTNDNIHQLLEEHRTSIEWKPKHYFMPIRLICTGRKDSPPLTQTLEVLGREMVRFRIRDALKLHLK